MPGAFRFLLACMVVVSHLSGAAWLIHAGFYAVQSFFVLSGFAVTAALNEVYHFDGARFLKARLLRIGPPYLFACAVTFLLIRALPHAGLFMARWKFPMDAESLGANLALIPLSFGQPDFRFIEPAWSVAIEIFMYVILYCGMARSPRTAIIGLFYGLAYHLNQLALGHEFAFRYFAIPSAILSYSIGALFYFGRKRLDCQNEGLATGAVLLWLSHTVVVNALTSPAYVDGFGYYCNTALAAAVVITMPRHSSRFILRKVDTILGDLSYPVFLLQWAGAFLAAQFLPEYEWRSWTLVILSAPFILSLSVLTAWLNADLVEPIRIRVRFAPELDDRRLSLSSDTT